MKKYTFVIFYLLFSFTQIEAQENNAIHDFVIGGSIGVTKSKVAYNFKAQELTSTSSIHDRQNESTYINKSFSTLINPYLAKRFSRRSMLGIGLFYDYESIKSSSNDWHYPFSNHETIIGLGLELFYRYHIPIGKKIELFLHAYFSCENSITKYEPGGENERNKYQTYLYSSGIDIGATYPVSKKWSLLVSMPGIKYHSSQEKDIDRSRLHDNKSLTLNTTFKNFRIGIEHRF